MIVHTNIEKHAIFYTIMHGPQICTINKRLVYIFIISQLWLTSHPKSTVVLLDTETPGTSREIYSEDVNDRGKV